MKIKDLLKNEGLLLVLLAVPFLVLIPLWDKFPARVPIHWGLDGQPNGWATKETGLVLIPAMNIGLVLLSQFISRYDSRVITYGPEKEHSHQRALKVFRLITVGFLAAMALMVDAVALGWKLDVSRLVTCGVLIVFAVLGNYFPKLRPNGFVGIRTPWTLKSPEVWKRTHRFFGRMQLIGSLLLIPPCLLLPSIWAIGLLLGFILLVAFGSMAYSYHCYQSLRPSTPP